jgi:hypothetical protein
MVLGMGEGDNSLVNLGDFSKPATVLIEKVSAAIGQLWEPRQLVRVAKAEVEAEKIKTLGRIELTEMQQKGLKRLAYEAGKQQENIESITADAASRVGDDAKPEGMDSDWITNFFEKAKLISDKEAQSLWSRVLAGEATAPGSYSKRTVELIANLDKQDAELFTQVCSFVINPPDPIPLVFDLAAPLYAKRGITFARLQDLDSIGLIKFDPLAGFVAQGLPEHMAFLYFGLPFLLQLPQKQNNTLQLGSVRLTKSGKELFTVCGAMLIPEAPPYFQEKFRGFGCQILSAPVMHSPTATNDVGTVPPPATWG